MNDFNLKLCHWSYYRQRLGRQADTMEQALKDIIGVYSWHPSAPVSLRARAKDFSEEAFYALDDNRIAYRIPAMRLSNYMIHKDDAHRVLAATVPAPNDPFHAKRFGQVVKNVSEEQYRSWSDEIIQTVISPMALDEVRKATGIADATIKTILNRMAREGEILRIGAKSLRSNILDYVSTRAWAGSSFPLVEPDKAMAWLAGEYLRAFGPARTKDFQWWISTTVGKAKAAMAAHETVNIGNDYLILATDLKEFEDFNTEPKDSIDILPQWDSYIMGYAPDGRQRFVSPDMQHHIYGDIGATGGNGFGTVMINGEVFAVWDCKFSGTKMNLRLNMFKEPGKKFEDRIEKEFQDLSKLFKAKKMVIERK